MDKFDVEAYYREKDRRMAMFGSESIEDYLARRNLVRMPTGATPPPDAHTDSSASSILQRASPAIDPDNNVLRSSANPDPKEAHASQGHNAINSAALATSNPPDKAERPVAGDSSPELGVIEFVPSVGQKQNTDSVRSGSKLLNSKATEKNRTSLRKKKNVSSSLGTNMERSSKRKATEEASTTPHKKLASSPSDAFEQDSIEEISAFERPATAQTRPKKNVFNNTAKPPSRLLRVPVLKDPKQVLPPNEDSLTSPISPIEDASGFSDLPGHQTSHSKRKRVEARPSLLDEVRSATTSGTTNSVAKAKGKERAQEPSEGDLSSVIYVSSAPSSRSASPAPAKKLKTSAGPVKKDLSSVKKAIRPAGSKSASTKKGGKKTTLVTPREYAENLMEQRRANPQRRYPFFQSLEGMTIYYYGYDAEYASERTRNRMKLLVDHGATLAPVYDRDTVTHIISQEMPHGSSPVPLLRKLGLKQWEDIPNTVPTVLWTWVVPALKQRRKKDFTFPYYWEHAAVAKRIDVGAEKPRPRVRPHKTQRQIQGIPFESDVEDSRIVNGAPISPPTSPSNPQASSSKVTLDSGADQQASEKANDDPLAPFYAQAIAQYESRWSRHHHTASEDDDTDVSDAEEAPVVPKRPRGFACDNPGPVQTACINQYIVDKLKELKEIHEAKPMEEDKWRVFSLSRAIRALMNHPTPITNFEQAISLAGVGLKTANKIVEIVETGDLRRIGYEMQGGDVVAMRLFQGIYGVGAQTAAKWVANGCRTLEDLTSGKGGVKLSTAQEIGVRFYEDINSRMPRNEAKALFDLIKPIALAIDPKLFVDIMGSYRRGKPDCGDIDILITRDPSDGRTHAGVLARLLKQLHRKGILTEDLALPDHPDDPDELEAIYRGLCRLPHVEDSRRRRIDFLLVPWTSRGAALLYYTGDDVFNRSMRLKARNSGYSLNQRGLFEGVVRDPKNKAVKLNTGTLVASETEEKIFEILKVPFVPPEGRVRNPVTTSL